MARRPDLRDLARATNHDRNTNYILSPPILALKEIWDEYSTQRRERRREWKLALSDDSNIVRSVKTFTFTIPFKSKSKRGPYITSALTSASATKNSRGTVDVATQTGEAGEDGVKVQDPAHRMQAIDATVELREMLEENLGHLNRPGE